MIPIKNKKKRIGPSRQEDNRPLFYKKDMGFKNICHIDGGFGAMKNSGFKVIK